MAAVIMSEFASTNMRNKYAHKKGDGIKESWSEISFRVANEVVGPYFPDLVGEIATLIEDRKFVPGGRYLYAAGRRFPQVNNCLSGETRIVTRDGTFSIKELIGKTFQILNRFGRWEDAEARSFGVQKLLRVTFENGDQVFATENHRWWTQAGFRVTTRNLQSAPLIRHNVKPVLDKEGIRHGVCYGDGTICRTTREDRLVLCNPQKRELSHYFDQEAKELQAGLTVTHLPKRYKNLPGDVCSPEYARGFIAGLIATDGSTKTSSVTIAVSGRDTAQHVRELAVLGGCVVTRVSLAKPAGHRTNLGIRNDDLYVLYMVPSSVPLIREDQIADRNKRRSRMGKRALKVACIDETTREEEVYCCVVPGTQSFTLANGVVTSNCFLFKAVDSREGWGSLMNKTTQSLMTGGGVGVVYSDLRGEGAAVQGMGGKSTGPCALMQMINEAGRHIMQGGSRRSALWAGLHWHHPDVYKFIRLKRWSQFFADSKRMDFNNPAPLDGTNISVILDTLFFDAYDNNDHPKHALAWDVYWRTIESGCETGDPGLSIDCDENEGENGRNACTEVTTRDDQDMCNLGSANLARIESENEMRYVTEMGTIFLVCGTLYSKLPLDEMYKVREKNRRIGLGLMGLHEWLLKHGKRYGPDEELAHYLAIYRQSGAYANRVCDKLSISRPVATRAIAPTGTISIVAETTSGCEPIFAAAYRRRYLTGQKDWKWQYVVDPAAKRLIEEGIDPDKIEDALLLSADVGRRISFQRWLQTYVDHGISSTINMPQWGTDGNNLGTIKKFGESLMRDLRELRGITIYPDGARDGQPLVRVPYQETIGKTGIEFDEGEQNCKSGVCSM